MIPKKQHRLTLIFLHQFGQNSAFPLEYMCGQPYRVANEYTKVCLLNAPLVNGSFYPGLNNQWWAICELLVYHDSLQLAQSFVSLIHLYVKWKTQFYEFRFDQNDFGQNRTRQMFWKKNHLDEASEYLEQVITREAKEDGINGNATKIIIGGTGQGGTVVYNTIFQTKHKLGGALPFNGFVPPYNLSDITEEQKQIKILG